MPESQEDIDALLAEVSALADEAVQHIAASGVADLPVEPPARRTEPRTSAAVAAPAPACEPAAAPAPAGGYVRAPDPKLPSAIRKPPPPAPCGDPDRILRLSVPVIVRLAERTMPMSEILGITTGSIIEFEKPADSELDLMINNKCIGIGQAVKVGENFGLRVTAIGTVRERIQAMGPSQK